MQMKMIKISLWTVANGHWQNTTSWYNSPDASPDILNAKIWSKLEGLNGIVGEHGVQSERNDNGEKFVSFYGINNLA